MCQREVGQPRAGDARAEDVAVQVRAAGPLDAPQLGVDADLAEDFGVAQGVEHALERHEVRQGHDPPRPVLEAETQAMLGQRLDGDDVLQHAFASVQRRGPNQGLHVRRAVPIDPVHGSAKRNIRNIPVFMRIRDASTVRNLDLGVANARWLRAGSTLACCGCCGSGGRWWVVAPHGLEPWT